LTVTVKPMKINPPQAAVTRLYPPPATDCPLEGLYFRQELRPGEATGKPFVYSNFISSLDGRIALTQEGRSTYQVPPAITNSRDWRLYQELAGQADILVTSGRYFRQSEIEEAQDRLPVSGHPDFSDIREWRGRQGLELQPDIAILSRSLDIPQASLEPYRNRRITVFTGRQAEADRMARLREQDVEVIAAGDNETVDGVELIAILAGMGYANIYAIAGPDVLHTLLKAKVLNRLYLTTTHQLLAGEQFDTLTRGSGFDPALAMQLVSLYLDRDAPSGASQWFSVFEPRGN
jgi:riboflavin biosynthesis pyrimidine reductase